jgi:hypothetical protein
MLKGCVTVCGSPVVFLEIINPDAATGVPRYIMRHVRVFQATDKLVAVNTWVLLHREMETFFKLFIVAMLIFHHDVNAQGTSTVW